VNLCDLIRPLLIPPQQLASPSDTDDGDDLVCHTYKNGNATLQLCEVDLDDYETQVRVMRVCMPVLMQYNTTAFLTIFLGLTPFLLILLNVIMNVRTRRGGGLPRPHCD